MKFGLFVAASTAILAAPLPVAAQAAKTDRVYAGCMAADAFWGKCYHSKLVELVVKPFVMDPQSYQMSNHYIRSQTALNAQFLAYLTSKGIETYGL
ncbi:hypothetical protein [Novosphingobium resinovorum]|uniref:Uncharacterized protein n=1 Tax=Novosphingobium resinovorum TaxID=158500 RepID=A0A1D8A2Q8_9SPHN|nr:hypothetical protein [Novosphingobium resinovorum]AOR76387.1 hypothetical protein BES08_06200 [Novosphingobium resinovorum]